MRRGTFSLNCGLAFIALVCLTATPGAMAGVKLINQLVIQQYPGNQQYPGYTSASGSLADVRNNGNPNDYIGCHLYIGASAGVPLTGVCMASNGTTSVYCSTTDPATVQLIASIKADSYVSFSYNSAGSSGICDSVYIATGSYITPIRP